MPTVTYKGGEIVIIPFPFTDKVQQKRRPALVISQTEYTTSHNHVLCAMITTAKSSSWPTDYRICDMKETGLPAPSIVRMKLFSLDSRLIIRTAGKVPDSDYRNVMKIIQTRVLDHARI